MLCTLSVVNVVCTVTLEGRTLNIMCRVIYEMGRLCLIICKISEHIFMYKSGFYMSSSSESHKFYKIRGYFNSIYLYCFSLTVYCSGMVILK